MNCPNCHREMKVIAEGRPDSNGVYYISYRCPFCGEVAKKAVKK